MERSLSIVTTSDTADGILLQEVLHLLGRVGYDEQRGVAVLGVEQALLQHDLHGRVLSLSIERVLDLHVHRVILFQKGLVAPLFRLFANQFDHAASVQYLLIRNVQRTGKGHDRVRICPAFNERAFR